MSLFRVLNSGLQHVSRVTNFASKYFQSLVHILISLDTVGFVICTILYCDPNHVSLPRRNVQFVFCSYQVLNHC